MVLRIWYEVECDKCGEGTLMVLAKEEARHKAIDEGYIRKDGQDLCQKCGGKTT